MGRKLTAIFVSAIAAVGVSIAQNILPPHAININGGPGLVITTEANVADLPAAANHFLQAYYKNTPVIKIKIDTNKGTADVTLSDNTHITFNKTGTVTDIRAPYGESINPEALIDLLPAEAVAHLLKIGKAGQVNEVKDGESSGVGVILLDTEPPQMIFNHDGTFVITNG